MPSFTLSRANKPYQPHGAARELMACQAPEVLLEGPAGTGKTRALLEKANLCALRHPGMRALLVRKTRESMTESILVTFEHHVVPANWPVLHGASRRQRQAYRYPNGSTLVLGGMDRASKIMSTEYDLVLAFEARELTEDDWEALLSRLRNGAMPYQQAIADTNPDAPSHWLNRRAEQGLMVRLRSRHQDNPRLPTSYLKQLAQLTGMRRERLYRGRWAAAEGLVYDGWDPALHVVDRFELPAAWRRIRSIDFGYTNPFVCQWWALDGDGRMYLYRELYITRQLVADCAQTILEHSRGELIETTLADHDAEDRATLHHAGVPTQAAEKALSRGLQAVAARLRPAGDGRPRLFLVRDCLLAPDERLRGGGLPTSTENEFSCYAWPSNTRHEATERPLDQHNHGLDALRYAVAYVDGLSHPPLSVRVLN